MGGDASTAKPEKWSLLVYMIYLALSFCIPPIGLGLGIYGLNKVGKRLDGFMMLCAAGAGVYYLPQLLMVSIFGKTLF